MKRTKRVDWIARQRSMMAIWHVLRPADIMQKGEVTGSDMRFGSHLTLSKDIDVSFEVHGSHMPYFQRSSETWALRLRSDIADTRIGPLRAEIEGSESTAKAGGANFEVLATFNTLEGISGYDVPELPLDAGDAMVKARLGAYSRRIERIWASVGGCRAENAEALILWIIRRRHRTGSGRGAPSAISTAIYFGEFDLASDLIAEMADDIEAYLKEDPTHQVRQRAYAHYCEIISRAAAAIRRSRQLVR